jgi:glycosyltransferase involved in cell wall biosynthesis
VTSDTKRLLVLAGYPESAAATRFRCCAFFDALRDAGVEPELRPFLDEPTFARFYEHGGAAWKARALARAMLRQAATLLRAGRYDGFFVQREAGLVGPALLEVALAEGWSLPMIFDFDDAIWLHAPGGSRHPIAARLLRSPRKTHHLLRRATRVVTGSHYRAEFARSHNADVTVVPTVVSHARWAPLPGRLDGALATRDGVPVVGWVGTHSTAAQLDLVVPALRELSQRGVRFRVRLVGASRTLDLPGVDVESVPWSLAREVRDFQEIDVGIAPMFDDEWHRGKCGFKQVQLMAVGVPFVSSPGGGAREFLVHGENALVADNDAEWTDSLQALLTDAALRARLARAGRELVVRRLSTEAQAPVVVDVVKSALDRRRDPRGASRATGRE